MAVITVSNTGGNWNATTTWVGGVVPSATLDTVAFTATSGNLTVNVASTCIGIDFTNYVNTITFTALLTINGSVNLGTGGYTQAGISGIQAGATATLTSGGVTWSRLWTFGGGSPTYTLADNWTFTGTLTFFASGVMTLNSNILNTTNLSVTNNVSIQGTTNIVFNGTGTWSHTTYANPIKNNITINTTGILTLGANIYYNTGTITYIAGTVTTTSSTLNIGASTTLNTSGMSWNNIVYTGGTTTITLSSNLVFIGTFTITGSNLTTITLAGVGIIDSPNGTLQLTVSGANLFLTTSATHNILNYQFNASGYSVNGSGTWNVYGNLIRNGPSNGRSGTGTINFVGTGSILFNGGSTGAFVGIWNINTSGTLTFGSVTFPNVYSECPIITYISGTVDASNCNLLMGFTVTGQTFTLNTSPINWKNITLNGTNTLLLTSNLNLTGNLTTQTNTITINGLFNVNVGGNININVATNGTATIVLNGTVNQTWLHGSAVNLSNNLTINKSSGTLTIGTNVYYHTGILTYIAGTVDTSGSTLNIALGTTLNTNVMTWNNISFTSGFQTLLSDLNVLNLTSLSTTINGLFNVNIGGNLRNVGIANTSGTATLVLNGTGTFSTDSNNQGIQNNLIINTKGTITLGTIVSYGVGTLTYIDGKIITKNSAFYLISSCTLINCHKINFNNVIIGVISTITMNEFFSGSPSLVTNISSNSPTTNNTIAFQDGFEKIAKFVNISNCTLSKPLQLLVLTRSKINSRNSGIRYINQSPNGIAKGEPSVNQTTFGAGGLLPDPINL